MVIVRHQINFAPCMHFDPRCPSPTSWRPCGVVGKWELTAVRRESDGSDCGLKVPMSWWWNQERRQHGSCALSSMLGPLPRQEQVNVGARLGVQGYAQTAHRSSRFCFRGFSTLLRDYTVRSNRFSRNLKHSNGFQASGSMQGAWQIMVSSYAS